MFVVWKRPDGFHGAVPSDFRVVDINGKATLWLHKKDTAWFPFRISGGWQEQEATQRLNQFVNLIDKPVTHWVKQLLHELDHSMVDESAKFFEETMTWAQALKANLKGDTWEVEIMGHVVDEIIKRLQDTKPAFMTKAKAEH